MMAVSGVSGVACRLAAPDPHRWRLLSRSRHHSLDLASFDMAVIYSRYQPDWVYRMPVGSHVSHDLLFHTRATRKARPCSA